MIRHPRATLVAIMALFALPIVASTVAYHFYRPEGSANHGELLSPPAAITTAAFLQPDGKPFRFETLRGKWVLIASDSGSCPGACLAKLTVMRQVRLALGRNAGRVVRVFVADDSHSVDPAAIAPFEGTVLVAPPLGTILPPVPLNDRAHLYVVDPLGNVMMRFPAGAEPRGLIKDLERLLRASQIG